MGAMHNTTAIILAAGQGRRLRPFTEHIPKALVPLDGVPLINYAIAFVEALWFQKIIVVGGYKFPLLKAHVESLGKDILVLENKEYHLQCLSSLAIALPHIEGGFFQCNTDYLYTHDIATRVKRYLNRNGIHVVGIPCQKDKIDDDFVKVTLDQHGNIERISKGLSKCEYEFMGMIACPADALPHYREAMHEALTTVGPEKARVWDPLEILAKKGYSVSVSNIEVFEGLEIDTPQDLQLGETFIRRLKGGANAPLRIP